VSTLRLRRLGRGQYATRDGRYVIENDSASMGEWDDLSEPEWFIYTAEQVQRGDYGPPEAVNLDGLPTLREARAYIERNLSDG
jgi:hypothetical protein